MIAVLLLYILIGIIIGGFAQCITYLSCTYKDDIAINTAFFFATHFYETYKNQLNRAGLAIGIVFIVLFTLPGSIFIIAFCVLIKTIEKIWELFKFLFKKKQSKEVDLPHE